MENVITKWVVVHYYQKCDLLLMYHAIYVNGALYVSLDVYIFPTLFVYLVAYQPYE